MSRRSFGRIALIYSGRLGLILSLCVAGIRETSILESQLFYAPSHRDFETDMNAQELFVTAADGTKIQTWFLPPFNAKPTDPPAPAVLFCHGNGGVLPNHLPYVQFLTHHGIAVMMFDYRSFGKSDKGRLLRDNLALDTDAALAALKARTDVDPTRLGVYGFSLGGTFALNAAANHPELRAVCTIAGFSSWSGIAGDRVPVLGPLLIPLGLDSVDLAARLGTRPYLIIHADDDRTVLARHAHVLEAAAKNAGTPVQKVIVSGREHSSIFGKHPELADTVTNFFTQALAPK